MEAENIQSNASENGRLSLILLDAGLPVAAIWREILGPYRKCLGAVQPGKFISVSRRGICDKAIWRKPLSRRTRWGSYGFCLGDSKSVRLWEGESRVVSEDSLGFGRQPRVSGQGLEVAVGGSSRAVTVDGDTKAIGVSDSVRVRGLGDRLGRVKPNPLV